MASKQTRRSISISGATYAKLKAYCVKYDRSMSSIVEETLKARFAHASTQDLKVVAWEGSPPTPPRAGA